MRVENFWGSIKISYSQVHLLISLLVPGGSHCVGFTSRVNVRKCVYFCLLMVFLGGCLIKKDSYIDFSARAGDGSPG